MHRIALVVRHLVQEQPRLAHPLLQRAELTRVVREHGRRPDGGVGCRAVVVRKPALLLVVPLVRLDGYHVGDKRSVPTAVWSESMQS
jgi:hypothetical protein